VTRVCTVCTHEKRYEIEEKLATRQGTYRGLARTYGVSEDAVSRHVSGGHIAQLIALAADAQRAAAGDSILDRIEALHARTLAILKAAEKTKQYRTALSAIREARGNLELIGEVTKEINRTPTLNLTLHPEYIEVRTLIVQALAPYPDARDAVVRAIASVGNGRA
jgi:hypothetical protein